MIVSVAVDEMGKAIERVGPLAVIGRYPGQYGGQGIVGQVVDAALPGDLHANRAGIAQDAEVLGHQGL